MGTTQRVRRIVCGLAITAALVIGGGAGARVAHASPAACDACTLDCRETFDSCRNGCNGDDDCMRQCNAALTACLGTCN